MALYKVVNSEHVLMTDAEEAAFHTQWQTDGLDKPRTKTVDDKKVALTAAEITEIERSWAANVFDWKKFRIEESHQIADAKVDQIVSERERMQYTIRALELVDKRDSGTALSVAEKDELDAIKAINNRARAVRAARELVESDINASTAPERFDTEGSARWPTTSAGAGMMGRSRKP